MRADLPKPPAEMENICFMQFQCRFDPVLNVLTADCYGDIINCISPVKSRTEIAQSADIFQEVNAMTRIDYFVLPWYKKVLFRVAEFFKALGMGIAHFFMSIPGALAKFFK